MLYGGRPRNPRLSARRERKSCRGSRHELNHGQGNKCENLPQTLIRATSLLPKASLTSAQSGHILACAESPRLQEEEHV